VAGRPPAFAEWLTPKPGNHPHEIHGRCRERLLEVRTGQSNVPTPAQLEAPRALREAALDARS